MAARLFSRSEVAVPIQPKPQRHQPIFANRSNVDRDLMLVEEEMTVPLEYHSLINGRQGSGFRKLMDQFHVSISVPNAADQSDVISIRGLGRHVDAAKEGLLVRVKELDKAKEERVKQRDSDGEEEESWRGQDSPVVFRQNSSVPGFLADPGARQSDSGRRQEVMDVERDDEQRDAAGGEHSAVDTGDREARQPAVLNKLTSGADPTSPAHQHREDGEGAVSSRLRTRRPVAKVAHVAEACIRYAFSHEVQRAVPASTNPEPSHAHPGEPDPDWRIRVAASSFMGTLPKDYPEDRQEEAVTYARGEGTRMFREIARLKDAARDAAESAAVWRATQEHRQMEAMQLLNRHEAEMEWQDSAEDEDEESEQQQQHDPDYPAPRNPRNTRIRHQ
ncbi:uncharacterized protein LOC129583008 isoform X2 [Paramacrobiotus metropolitanus]|uniref:uncharacterized protein LOC129583008 isoform X2 n=1 Tax=Paramacrobiotus metropolitanus TaxID=2943436 RepID=UPI00244645CC|nr:uncharacterized protein LOC129583008 isoform X2 [Paramacrobiotus metropolitanus]